MIQIAKVLTAMQVMLLREAAALPPRDRTEQISEITKFVKKQNSRMFFHDKDGKPDRAMRDRKFHDEPRNLELAEYASYEIPFVSTKQRELYKARNKRLLKDG